MVGNTLRRDYDLGRIIDDYERRLAFLERRLTALFGNATSQSVATQACRVTATANQSIPNGATTSLVFDDEISDNNAMHDNGVNPTRITFNEAGHYVVGGDVQLQAGNDYVRMILNIRLNAGNNVAVEQIPGTSNNVQQRIAAGTMRYFDAGDYIELRLFQQNGAAAARDAEVTPEYSPVFYAGKIGP